MRLLNSVVIGLIAAVMTAVALTAGLILVAFGIGTFETYSAGEGLEGGVDGGGFSVNVGVLLLISLAAGVTGFFWRWKRGRPSPV